MVTWQVSALLSAVFAAMMPVLAKIGVRSIDSASGHAPSNMRYLGGLIALRDSQTGME